MSPALLLVLLGLPQSSQEVDSLARDHVVGTLGARVDSQLTRFAEYGFSGTVLVVRDHAIVLLKGYGLADREHGVPNTAATRFEMNSMTKMFTGAAILQLAAGGRLSPGDPVAQYLKDFPPGQGATIEQLATHTSGLVVEGSDLAGDSRQAFIRDVASHPPESAPGERYRYSNAGFSLLAAIIETASGETYEGYLRRYLFAPADMRTALFRNEVPATDPRYAHGYVGTPAEIRPGPPNPYAWGTVGAGGVWSTVGDMYRWIVALEERRILPEAQWRRLTSPPRPPAQEAFGWHVDSAPDGRARIQKGGGSDDFASQLLYYPDDSVVLVWASNNLRQRWRQALNQTLPRVVFSGESFSLPAVVSLGRSMLEARAGRFLRGRDTLEVHPGAGYFYATANRLEVPADVMFFPQNQDHFTGFDPSTRSVTRLEFGGENGRSLRITLSSGRQITAIRASDR